MYQMLLRGHAPASEPFRKWGIEEVLPTIRKTCKYNAEESFDPVALAIMDELKSLRSPERQVSMAAHSETEEARGTICAPPRWSPRGCSKARRPETGLMRKSPHWETTYRSQEVNHATAKQLPQGQSRRWTV